MNRKTIAILFGGQSSEHEVSCMSAANVIDQIDREKYELLLIGITKEGHWVKTESVADIRSGEWSESKTGAVLSPDATDQCVIIHEKDAFTKVRVDAVFPVLHGLYGEDGTVQGLLNLSRIPYVGDGVLASAVGMDKLYTKIIAAHIGVRQAAFELVVANDMKKDPKAVLDRVEKHFSYPVFVKPCNAGSSCGISKAENRAQLFDGIGEALYHDRKVLVEEMIVGHEVECAVLGGGNRPVFATGVGEIHAAADFYDYSAKYFNPESRTVMDPVLPGRAAEEIPETAKRIFRAIDGYGLARVDFFVTEQGEVIFNEINTMPGFTAISMYPMLWEARGKSKKELIQELIDLAFERQL